MTSLSLRTNMASLANAGGLHNTAQSEGIMGWLKQGLAATDFVITFWG